MRIPITLYRKLLPIPGFPPMASENAYGDVVVKYFGERMKEIVAEYDGNFEVFHRRVMELQEIVCKKFDISLVPGPFDEMRVVPNV